MQNSHCRSPILLGSLARPDNQALDRGGSDGPSWQTRTGPVLCRTPHWTSGAQHTCDTKKVFNKYLLIKISSNPRVEPTRYVVSKEGME